MISKDSYIFHHLDEILVWFSVCERGSRCLRELSLYSRTKMLSITPARAEAQYEYLTGQCEIAQCVDAYNRASYPGMFHIPVTEKSPWFLFELQTHSQIFMQNTDEHFSNAVRKAFSPRAYDENRAKMLALKEAEYRAFCASFPNYREHIFPIISLFREYQKAISLNQFASEQNH
jgi:hypothetical protein